MADLLVAVRWRDVLDILLVALIVYRLLVAFRGTRAAQMLVGLGILLAAIALSVIAAALCMPIDERAIERAAVRGAA